MSAGNQRSYDDYPNHPQFRDPSDTYMDIDSDDEDNNIVCNNNEVINIINKVYKWCDDNGFSDRQWNGTRLLVKKGGMCPICKRVHKSNGGFIYASTTGLIYYYCYDEDAQRSVQILKDVKLEPTATIEEAEEYRRIANIYKERQYNKIVEEANYKFCDIHDGYTIANFASDYNAGIYTKESDILAVARSVLVKGRSFYIMKEEIYDPDAKKIVPHYREYKLSEGNSIFASLCYIVNEKDEKGKEKEKKIMFKDFLQRNERFFTCLSTYFLPGEAIKVDRFNSYTGLPWRDMGEPDESKIRNTLYYLDNIVLKNEDDKVNKFIKSFIASKLFNPGMKPPIALLLYGDYGTGKSTIGEILIRLFGKYSFKLTDDTLANGTFNKHKENKLISIIDDCRNLRKDTIDGMKLEITSNTDTIHPKGMNAYKTASFNNYICCTNDIGLYDIREGDRRWIIIEPTDELRYTHLPENSIERAMKEQHVKSYTTELYREIYSDDSMNHLYTYFHKYYINNPEIKHYSFFQNGIPTNASKKLIKANREERIENSGASLLHDWLNNNLTNIPLKRCKPKGYDEFHGYKLNDVKDAYNKTLDKPLSSISFKKQLLLLKYNIYQDSHDDYYYIKL